MNKIDGIERIRLGSLDPFNIDKAFVDTVKSLGKVMPHFHISMQNGSTRILNLMRRKYNADMAEERIPLDDDLLAMLPNLVGYYVLLDAPEILSPAAAKMAAESLLGEGSAYACDGLVISGYLGSDVIKPFLPYCKKSKKDIFVVTRTANKSAPELQDLLSGTRLVHAAAADHVNRYGADTAGKFGYTRVGILAAASAAESLRSLRTKYPQLFFLLDGYDYPNANAKNCSFAFDKYGHGAAACGGSGITCAWKQQNSDGADYLEQAKAAAERMKKNLTRYVTVL